MSVLQHGKTILLFQNKDQWWTARNADGKEGLVPLNFFRPCGPPPRSPPQPNPIFNNIDDASNVVDGPSLRKEHLCTLPLNLYNDRLFASVAALLFLVTICLFWSLIEWTAILSLPALRDTHVRKVLREEVVDVRRNRYNRCNRPYLLVKKKEEKKEREKEPAKR